MKLCQENDEDKICYEKQVFPAGLTVDDVVANLKMCSLYTLDVFPLYDGGEIKTRTSTFRTKSPVQNPQNVQISIDNRNDSWLVCTH